MGFESAYSPRVSRAAAEEVERRLVSLIEAAEAAIRAHEREHLDAPCFACAFLLEKIIAAREAVGALV